MSDKTIQVEIVSPEESLFSGEAKIVFAPSVMGEIGVAPRHAPLLAELMPGEVRVKTKDGVDHSFYVSGGILEVQPGVVTVLSDTAMRAEDIDEARAKEAKESAATNLLGNREKLSYAKAEIELAEASARWLVLQRLKKRRG